MEVIMSSCWSVLHDMGFVDGMLTHWCRFRNLAVGTDEPIPEATIASARNEILRFREVTSFVLMPEFVPDVRCRLALTNKPTSDTDNNGQRPALALAETHLPSQSQSSPVKVATIIPAYVQENIPPTPIRKIINSPQTPRKFHCCARVRSIWPSDVEKICKPKPDKNGEFIYSFALTVEEGDVSLDLIVYDKDAEHFLHGIPHVISAKAPTPRHY